MLDEAVKILKQIDEAGYIAYIVGGYVRDYLLGIESNDIDITTNATPKELQEIFTDSVIKTTDYGSITIMVKNIRYEITTFRKEIKYIDHRKPEEIEYVNDLYTDLNRRDFTINSICMDENKEIFDFLNGKEDLKKRLVNTIGNAKERFEEDSLRILRAVRFATTLDFKLSDEVREAIIENRNLLKDLSYNRKKEELDKIFASPNVKNGIGLLLELGLDKPLELERLKDIKNTDSLISVWAMLNVLDIYPFTNAEKELIEAINAVMDLDNMDSYTLYKYGLYVNSVAGAIKGVDKKDITEKYDNLPIKSKDDISISAQEIMDILKKEPGKYISDIYSDLEQKILSGNLKNTNEDLEKYIKSNYQGVEC